jgi:glycosyltransferase involved in cell wall biosynthesis
VGCLFLGFVFFIALNSNGVLIVKIRVITVHPFDPWGTKVGGIESLIRSICRYAPDDFRLEIIGVSENPRSRPIGQWTHLAYNDRPVSFYPVLAQLHPNQRSLIPLSWRFARKLHKQKQGDNNAIFFYHRIEPLAFASIPSKKNLLCIHGNPDEMTGVGSEGKWRFLPGIYKKYEAAAIEKTHKLWVVSQTGKQILAQRYPHKTQDMDYMPAWYENHIFSLPTEEERTVARQKQIKLFNCGESAKFVLFAGRWEKQKNPTLALEAFAHVAEHDANAHLIMVGTGSLQSDIEKAVNQYNLKDRVHFTGVVGALQLAEIMKACHALILSSGFEGLPVIMLEALASGLPVVSTNTGEVKTILKEGVTGRLIEKPDPKWLADGIFDTLQYPERYNRIACVQSVQPYQSPNVLKPLFETIRTLVHNTASQNP